MFATNTVNMGLFKTAVSVVVFGTLAKFIINTVIFFDPWKTVLNHAPGPCRLVEGVEHGSEDIETLPNGLALITSGMKFMKHIGDPRYKDVKGEVLLFDFKKPTDAPVSLKIDATFDLYEFSPHGLSIHQHKSGAVHVYLVNHPPSGDCVEKFEFDQAGRRLKHLKTIKDASFGVVNDLVVVDDDKFYITNYLHTRGEPLWAVEMYIGLHWGSVLYYDGNKFQEMASHLYMPNGVNVSPDGRYLYVAATGSSTFHVYERHTDNSLTLKESTNLGTRLDNIDVQKDEVWIGCHPSTWQISAFMSHSRETSPSQVLRLKIKDGHLTEVTEVYADDGHRLHGSSSAARYGDAMLVGTIKSQLMYCDFHYIGN